MAYRIAFSTEDQMFLSELLEDSDNSMAVALRDRVIDLEPSPDAVPSVWGMIALPDIEVSRGEIMAVRDEILAVCHPSNEDAEEFLGMLQSILTVPEDSGMVHDLTA